MNLDDQGVQRIIDEVLRRLTEQPMGQPTGQPMGQPAGQPAEQPARPSVAPSGNAGRGDAAEGRACTPPARPPHGIAQPAIPEVLPKLLALTPSQIAMGRAGNRFRTDDCLRAREGHADARDAVHSEVPEGWAKEHSLVPLRTRCKDRPQYLLFPNLGRQLDGPSDATVQGQAGSAPDVQLIVGDGLSPNAIVQNGAATLAALQRALTAAGWRLGTGFYVKYARIAVADQIGVLTRARASVILVGERPGLGTGDSLSLYIAVAPKLGQDNAEKNCISNVRPIGITPDEAAEQTVAILKRGFERGVGGVALGLGWGRS